MLTFRLLLILLSMSFLLQGCSPQQEPLRLGTNLWLGYEPFYIAREKGWFQEDQVRILEFSSSMDVMRGLRAGTLDAGALTLDEALLLAAHVPDLRIGLILDYSNGADALLARSGIQQVEALRGKKVGVENTGTGSYVLSRALASAGMTLADIKVTAVSYDEHLEAFRKNRVDAIVTYEPARSELMKEGATSLFDTRRIPGEVIDVLVYRKATPALSLANLAEGWCKATQYQRRNPVQFVSLVQSRQRLPINDLNQGLSDIHLVDCIENQSLFHSERANLIRQAQRLEQHLKTVFPDEQVAPMSKIMAPLALPAKDAS